MKKKILTVGLALVMSMAMLTGCGSSKKDYENDLKEFAKLQDVDSSSDFDSMAEAVEGLDVTTSEGKDIKKDLKELVDMASDMMSNLSDLASMDEDELTKMQDDLEKLSDKVDEDVEAFQEAAEDAGLDKGDLDDLIADMGL